MNRQKSPILNRRRASSITLARTVPNFGSSSQTSPIHNTNDLYRYMKSDEQSSHGNRSERVNEMWERLIVKYNFTIRSLWDHWRFPISHKMIQCSSWNFCVDLDMLVCAYKWLLSRKSLFSFSIFALKITQSTHVEKWYISMIPFMYYERIPRGEIRSF